MNKDHIVDILKQSFNDFEVQLSAGSFDRFSVKLQAAKRKKRRRALAFLLAATGLAGGLLFMLIYGNSSNPGLEAQAGYIEKAPFASLTPPAGTVKQTEKTSPGKQGEKITSSVGQNSKTASAHPGPIAARNPLAAGTAPVSGDTATGPPNHLAASSILSESAASPAIEKPGIANQEVNYKTDPIIDTLTPYHFENIATTVVTTLQEDPSMYLSPIPLIGLPVEQTDLLPQQMSIAETQKQLLRLKAKELKPGFFVGISYMPLLFNYRYAEDLSASQSDLNGFNSIYNSLYVANRGKDHTLKRTGIPGIKAGVVLKNKTEIGITGGYYTLKQSEGVYEPPATTSLYYNNPVPNSPNSVPVSTVTTIPLRNTLAFNSGGGDHYENSFSYWYLSAGITRIISFGSMAFRPGLSVSYNRVSTATYLFLDTSGYSYRQNDTKYINRNVFNLCFSAGISKTFFRAFQLQLSPAAVLSPSSVFSRGYFMTQRMFGFGLEAAIVYRLK